MKALSVIAILLFVTLSGYSQAIISPQKKLTLRFQLTEKGEPTYQLSIGNKKVTEPSLMGLELKDQPALAEGFTIISIDSTTVNEKWNPVWGEVSEIVNNYRELTAKLQQTATGRVMIIRFRLFDDGLGFRYEFPAQAKLSYFTVTGERTQYNMTGNHKSFWIPGDYDTNEYPYTTSALSDVDAVTVSKKYNEIGTRSPIGKNVVQTPFMMNSADGLYINIHEAALLNYPAMYLKVNQDNFSLSTELTPDAFGNKAYLQTPCNSPWRTLLVSYKAADLLMSKTILNLNEPSVIKETSWIKPQKFVGIWWGMHMGTATWNYADQGNIILKNTDWSKLKPNGKHGATTQHTKRYIDFAVEQGLDGVLIEGWNVGWEDWAGNWKEEVFDFVTPYPDFNVNELQAYAKEKGVKLIMHHETSSSVTNYERRIDQAIRFMKDHGYDAVKTGYVGRIIPRGEFHDGQWMINHFTRVAEKFAANKIMVDAHESVRPTGLHRTYPNWMASEAARGNEFNAWSSGNPPEHETILPFTRLMGGPMDYTPGIFQIKLDYYNTGNKYQVHTTLAKQLALYVTMYSPLQMAADLPENYEKHLDAFQFIKDVPVDWDNTKVLEAEPGDYIVTARKQKGKDAWFIGAITDENKREVQVNFNFLEPKKTYVVTIYGDAPDAHWETNPMAYSIQNYTVTSKTILKLKLAAGGGAALKVQPATPDQSKKVKPYRN
ncbi:MAG: glycoside hydrolase family 97 protein [Cyclobacteriaceae bacterium]